MSLRKHLKTFKGTVKKEFRELLEVKAGQASGSTPSTPAEQLSGTRRKWPQLASFSQVLHASSDSLGPLKPVVDGLLWCVEAYENSAEAQEGYATLKADLEELFEVMLRHFSGNVPPPMTEAMNHICIGIEKELDKISRREQGSTGSRYLEAEMDIKEVMESYGRIQKLLEQLMATQQLNANLDMWKIVDQQATEARLDKLTPSMSACFDSAEAKQIGRRECTPKTREGVLEILDHWSHDSQQDNLYWLSGMAGTGKTTIASTFCAMLHQSRQLGASFFCTRSLPECREVKLILPSIAYQLARFSRPFRHALSESLERSPDLRTKSLPVQLADLIVNPLLKAKTAFPKGIIIVIDALDECEDNYAVEELLQLFMGRIPKLPLKIFVSSRPEPQMRVTIARTNSKLILHDIEKSVVKEDIGTYLRSELGEMSLFDSDSELEPLVERAGVLFIYAATVVRYIKAGKAKLNCRDRFKLVLTAASVLSPNKANSIDALYTAVLDSAFGDPDLEQDEQRRMKLVLDTVICTQEPLTIDALARLLRLDDGDRVRAALNPLWSVLHIFGTNSIVTTLHASFPEYMLDPARSLRYHCISGTHHGALAEFCFTRIKANECQFNICGLESSFVPDNQVHNLDDQIKNAIPLELVYASRYWAIHLERGGQSTERSKMLYEFLSDRLLLWMEILNLLNLMDLGAQILRKAEKWNGTNNSSQEVGSLLYDAWRFASMFAMNAVSRSTPHIYISMLATWPESRPISLHYLKRSKGLPRIGGTRIAQRQTALLGVFPVGSPVLSLALSHDGIRIVSGSGENPDQRSFIFEGPIDNAIRVWDAHTGQMVLGPLHGHRSAVLSVAFSPDGAHIVSGSEDGAVVLRDAETGQLVLGPLEGHTQAVRSISFSPDGKVLLSGTGGSETPIPEPPRGSFDRDYENAIYIRDAQTGQILLGPLKGHAGAVNSASFSPDGSRIASGSKDRSIRIWDSQTGRLLCDPIYEPTDSVHAVSFSPDSTHIVVGLDPCWNDGLEYDLTSIHVWNIKTRTLVMGSMGLDVVTTSVAFSHDGMWVVSGSEHGDVCLWDVTTGELLLGPLLGHTGPVRSVVFSPDKLRIISGSEDGTIRFWDSHADGPALRPLGRPSLHVASVAFSPDSAHIVTCFSSGMISLRDAQTGGIVHAYQLGHSKLNSVALSFDGGYVVYGCSGERLWYKATDTSDSIYTCDTQTGQRLLGPLKGHNGPINSVAFSPNGRLIASGSGNISRRFPRYGSPGELRVWDADNGQLVLTLLEGQSVSVTSVIFSPDNLRVVAGCDDAKVRICDLSNECLSWILLEGHTFTVLSVAFSPNGALIASGSFDRTVRLWDAKTGELILEPLVHTGQIRSVAFSPDSTRIVSSSGLEDKPSDDALDEWFPDAITVWDVQSGQPLLEPLQGHAAEIESVAFSPDGTRIVSGDVNGVVHTWDARARLATNPSLSPLSGNGWVVDDCGNLLLWIPHDLCEHILTSRTPLSISPRGTLRLQYDDALIGESWVDCYTPVPPV